MRHGLIVPIIMYVMLAGACRSSDSDAPPQSSGDAATTAGASAALAAPREQHPAPDPTCAVRAADPSDPVEPASRRTTAGAIATANLDTQLAGLEAALATRPDEASLLRSALDLRLLRAQFLGRTSDLDGATALATTAVATHPRLPDAHLMHARASSAAHEWDAALASIDRASELGADPTEAARRRDAVLLAAGRVTDVGAMLARAEAHAAAAPGIESHSEVASLYWQLGRFEDADRSFRAAVAAYKDVAPWVVAWSDFQRGVMWAESANRPDLAKPLYRAARERLPGYNVAVVHHAELIAEDGQRAEARSLLEGLAATVEDPEALGVLATLLAEDGEATRAEALRTDAKARYEGLLERHRAAYADHAAEFFMGVAPDPDRALGLALGNLESRPTGRAFQLAIEAAANAKSHELVCELITRARREVRSSPVLCQVIRDAGASCP